MRQGVLKTKEVFFIRDGASWIRKLKNNYFEAIGVLDIWHLERTKGGLGGGESIGSRSSRGVSP